MTIILDVCAADVRAPADDARNGINNDNDNNDNNDERNISRLLSAALETESLVLLIVLLLVVVVV